MWRGLLSHVLVIFNLIHHDTLDILVIIILHWTGSHVVGCDAIFGFLVQFISRGSKPSRADINIWNLKLEEITSL